MTENKNPIDADHEYARATYYDLIERGRDALEKMLQVADETEHPRAFEVLSGLIKNLGDTTEKLMDLNKKTEEVRDIIDPNRKGLPGPTPGMNVLLLSTDEILKKIEQREKDVTDTGCDSGRTAGAVTGQSQ